MNALDSLVNSEGYTDTDTQHRERAAAELAAMRAENAYERSHADRLIEFATTKMDMQALELAAMRQLISEQMERIQQQQAVVNAARVIERIVPDLLDAVTVTNQELAAFEALHIALAALPQPSRNDGQQEKR
jgi:hypothetical protein